MLRFFEKIKIKKFCLGISMALALGNNAYAAQKYEETTIEVLPPQNLFDAPIADPRWPKFLLGLSHDFEGSLGKTIWTFNFGEDIGIVKFGNKKSPFEFGVQAAAFGIMDINSTPTRLINTDYFVALYISHQRNNFQHLWEINHQSSHVGDEYLLSPDGQNLVRVNLSYEMLKYSLRYKHSPNFSPYIYAGYIITADPNYIKRWDFAAGVDLYSRKIIFKDSTRLIAGAYVNTWEENNFHPTYVVRAGLQYERIKYCNRFLQLLVEYTGGKSQQGQFYDTTAQQVGILVAFST